MSNAVRLDSLKKGDLFTLVDHDGQEVDEDIVLIRGEYDRSTRKYLCIRWNNIGRSCQYKGSMLVYVDFIF